MRCKTLSGLNFWNIGSPGETLMHRADENKTGARRKVLLVFVHGWLGRAYDTWQRLPEYILKRTDVDVDVVSYQYSTAFWRATSVEDVAAELRLFLESVHERLGRSQPHDHILFVTHSTGGLVVKQLVVDCAEDALSHVYSDRLGASDNQLPLRFRAIDHIAVPHFGASRLVTWPLVSFTLAWHYSIGWLFARILKPIGAGWGLNRINLQLRWNNNWVKNLDEKFQNALEQLDLIAFPRPVSRDILAKEDIIVLKLDTHPTTGLDEEIPKHSRFDTEVVSRQLAVRNVSLNGTHTSMIKVKNPDADVVRVLAAPLERLPSERELQIGLTLCFDNFVWFRKTARNAKVLKQMWDLKDFEQLNGEPVNSQLDVFKEVRKKLAYDSLSQCIVIAAERGAGKTVMLRKLAQASAADFMADGSARPVPFYAALDGLKVDLPVDGRHGIESQLTDYLAVWARKIGYRHDKLGEDFASRLDRGNFVLYLDEIDVFLERNRDEQFPRKFMRFLHDLVDRTHAEGSVHFVLAIGEPKALVDPKDAARPNDLVYRISPFTEDMAKDEFPEIVGRLLSMSISSSTRQLLCSRMILSRLTKEIVDHRASGVENESDLLSLALRCIHDDQRPLQNFGRWLSNLIMIAHSMFRSRKVVMPLDELQSLITQEAKSWEQTATPNYATAEIAECRGHFAKGIDDLKSFVDENLLLIARGGNVPDQIPTVALINAEWQHYLVAEYVARSIIHRRFDVLVHMGHTSGMFRRVAEQLAGQVISSDDIEQAISAGSHAPQVMAALSIILALSNVRMDQAAISKLLQFNPDTPAFDYGRAIQLFEFYHRVLSDRPDDGLKQVLRGELTNVLETEFAEATPIRRSAAWSYSRALANAENKAWDVERPRLVLTDQDCRRAAYALCNSELDPAETTPEQRVMQRGMCEARHLFLCDDRKVIAVVHWMSYLAAVSRCRGAVGEVVEGVQDFFSEGGHIHKRIKALAEKDGFPLPEIVEVYEDACGILR